MAVKVTIIGMDALGQSIGLALKGSGQVVDITAHDRENGATNQAVQAGAADRGEWNLLSAVEGADLIFVNEPLPQLRETFGFIGEALRRDAVVTDTSTIKEPVLRWARELLPPTVHYVGGTPLVTATSPNRLLFQKRRYAVVLLPDTPEPAVRLVSNAIALLGAEPLFIEVEEHDLLLAAVNHLPVLTGAALLQLTTQSGSWREMALMAGTTYGNATTMPVPDAASLAAMLRHNRDSLGHWIDMMQGELENLKELLGRDDEGASLERQLEASLEARARWQISAEANESYALYDDAIQEAKELNTMSRLFSFRRRPKV